VDPTIFITHSSKDQKVARTICTALENRGLACWISSRNVKPGQNYQEQIVRAIRTAKIMVLVFTANANNSNEIKKELALASQNNLIVIPVRIEDVTPNEAFAYEFATRQWIDMFDDWENSIARLVELIAASIDDRMEASAGLTGVAVERSSDRSGTTPFIRRPGPRWTIVAGLAVVAAAVIAYEVVTPSQQVSVSATVTKAAPTQSEPPALVAAPAPIQQAVPAPQPPQLPVHPDAKQVPAPGESGGAVSSQDVAAQAWAATKDTTSEAVLNDFIRQFGSTVFGSMARARLEEIKKRQVVAAVPPPQKPNPPTVQADPPGSFEPAINREGITITGFNLNSPDGRICQSSCINQPQCAAWVYRSPQGRTDGQPHCWLRNNVMRLQGDNLTISGDVQR